MNAPEPEETLFTVTWVGAYQPVGAPLAETAGHIRAELTLAQLRRLQRELKPYSIVALTYLLEYGYKPGQPTVYEGWGSPWLIRMGMGKSAAEKAVRELRDKGYVKAFKVQGSTTGVQLGVLMGGLGEKTEFEGEPRTDGRPRTASPNQRNREVAPGNPVDNLVPPIPRNEVPPVLGIAETEVMNVQVRPVSPNPGIGNSGPPSSREIEELFYEGADKIDFEWVRAYLTQPRLLDELNRSTQRAITVLSAALSGYEMTAAPLMVFLDGRAPGSATGALASRLVDYLRGDRTSQSTKAIRKTLDEGNVFLPKGIDDETLRIAFITAAVTSLDKPDISSLAAWFGSILKSRRFLANRSARTVLQAFDSIMTGNDASVLAPGDQDRERILHLSMIAIPTPWVDDAEMFGKFLRNPSAQQSAEKVWDKLTEQERDKWLTADRQRQVEGRHVTHADFVDGAVWDGNDVVPAEGVA